MFVRASRGWLLLIAACCLSASSGFSMSDKRDPQSGRIRVLNMGADAVPGTASPLVVLLTDPLISAQTVPLYSTIFDPRRTERYMRVYMPRTEESMKQDYDLILISDATVDNFPVKYFPWMIHSVVDGGLGFLTTGGSAMYGGRDQYLPWNSVSIIEIFAVAFEPYQTYLVGQGSHGPVKIVPNDGKNEFVASLPWGTAPSINYMIHIVQTRQGATTLLAAGIPEGHPLLSYWDIGNGRATNLIFDWYPWRLEPFQKWTYYIDFAGNLIYFSAGVRVPQDLELVHSLRSMLAGYFERRTILLSVIAFVEKFGANANRIEREIGVLDSDFSLAQQLYRDQEWEASKALLEDIKSRAAKLDDEAIKLKDRALFWIYVVEWSAVTATLMVSGSVVWALMVRRRLYGEVGVTRLR